MTEKIIEQGTEVVIEETDGDIVKVKYIYPAKTDEHYSTKSNLNLIEKITPEIKKVEDNAQSFILPYRTKETDKNIPNSEKFRPVVLNHFWESFVVASDKVDTTIG